MRQAETLEVRPPISRCRTQWLPPEQPIAMPEQDLARLPDCAQPPPASQPAEIISRWGMLAGSLVLTAGFAWQLYTVLSVVQMTPIQGVFLVLSTLAFAWVAIGSMSALAGGLLQALSVTAGATLPRPGPLRSRVALLFPIYHEAPETIAGSLEAMAHALARVGGARGIDAFVLSDSRTTEAAQHEQAVFATATERLAGILPLFYRRRPENTGRKAGNIADWVQRHGGGYDAFIVLDADSLMTGELVIKLARAMEMNPRHGLIQTVPQLIGGQTLFQRLQQFAAAIYGPPISNGIAAWQGRRGNYWGHNAIIRTRAFAATAGLPHLPGRAPFGGAILSHDFVEAALMQRAGWEIVMAPAAAGSYEGSPPTIVEHVIRDRRWAQGNLQHLAVLQRARLTGMGRLHMLMGAASYIASALWAASIVVGLVLALQGQHLVPSYFQDSKTLFPIWPVIDAGAALRLMAATLIVVMLPKIVGLALEACRGEGPRLRRTGGVFLETVASMLLAPVLMVTQTRSLVEIVMGRDAGWNAQRRAGENLSLPTAFRLTLWHLGTGIVAAAVCFAVSIDLALWMSPVLLGLLLSGPILWTTSRPPPEAIAKLLSTDDAEIEPAITASAARYARAYSGLTACPPSGG
jgi:membrane glycosyltransferase